MAVHRVTKILPYQPDQLAELVADVKAYPQFVPWVTGMRTWNRRAKKWARLDPARLARPAAAGGTSLVVISNNEVGERFAIRRAALHAIRESTRRVVSR